MSDELDFKCMYDEIPNSFEEVNRHIPIRIKSHIFQKTIYFPKKILEMSSVIRITHNINLHLNYNDDYDIVEIGNFNENDIFGLIDVINGKKTTSRNIKKLCKELEIKYDNSFFDDDRLDLSFEETIDGQHKFENFKRIMSEYNIFIILL
jgi:hypothetical protein